MAVEGGGGAVDFLFMKITGQILSLMQGRSPTKSNARARTYDRPEVIDKSKLGYLRYVYQTIKAVSKAAD
ncbi:hypothetical protein MMC24_000549 [Lignoscripta atroalba]|nr:hypothetical protein [Lignoscripta atroalba]